MSIIIKDLDTLLIKKCDLLSYKNLVCVNKNYYDLISTNKLFNEWKDVENKKKLLDIYDKIYYSCKMNYRSYAKFLIIKFVINRHRNKEYIFRTCCRFGQLKLMKHSINMYEKTGQLIDIHLGKTINDSAIDICCCNGNVEVAKYVIKLSEKSRYEPMNIDMIKNAIRLCCVYNEFEMLKFMIEICNKMKLIQDINLEEYLAICRRNRFNDLTNYLIDMQKNGLYLNLVP